MKIKHSDAVVHKDLSVCFGLVEHSIESRLNTVDPFHVNKANFFIL